MFENFCVTPNNIKAILIRLEISRMISAFTRVFFLYCLQGPGRPQYALPAPTCLCMIVISIAADAPDGL